MFVATITLYTNVKSKISVYLHQICGELYNGYRRRMCSYHNTSLAGSLNDMRYLNEWKEKVYRKKVKVTLATKRWLVITIWSQFEGLKFKNSFHKLPETVKFNYLKRRQEYIYTIWVAFHVRRKNMDMMIK